jgi:GNAT superfamily N-acetyltransferase
MDYEFRTYTPDLLGQVAALRFEQWLEAPSLAAASIAWKYEQNPYSDGMWFYVALAEGKVVGTRGMFGGAITSGREVFPVAAAVDNLVAPAHRGHGVSVKLTRFALDDVARQGCDYALSLSANRVTRLLSLHSGWKRVCPYQTLYWGKVSDSTADVRPRRTGLRRGIRTSRFYPTLRTAWAYIRRAQRWVRSPGEPSFGKFDVWASAPSRRGIAVVEQAPRPKQMAGLVQQQAGNDPRIRLVRDEQYYAWRFNDPRSTYRFLFAEAGESGLDCFLVLQLAGGSDGGVAIADWQYRDERAWLDLVRAVQESGSVSGLSIWSATLPASLIEGLEGLGFRAGVEADTRTNPAMGLLVTSTRLGLSPEEWVLNGRAVTQPKDWDLRMIHSDFH